MDIEQIQELMRSMQEHGVTALKVEEGNMQVKLERQPLPMQMAELPQEMAPPAAQSLDAQAATAAPAQGGAQGADVKELSAPMVGTFHERPTGAVKAGMALKKGEVACVIEAMKLMNEITMQEDGQVAFVALKEGDMVEYSQMIMQYR